MSVASKKKAEGEGHLKAAEKALKTSLMKWSPDHDSAADEYSRAATCFKVAKMYTESLDCLEKACECYKNCKSLYQAGKMLEQAVLVCRDSDRFDQITNFAERGGLMYRQHGSPESAAGLLEKAAKILESKNSEEALALYEKAAETIMVEDRPKQAAEYLTKVARLQAKNKSWEKAAETSENAIKLLQEAGSTNLAGRLVCGMVLCHIARDDVIAASKSFSVWGGYCDPDQSAAVNTIINGFSDEDGEMAKQGLNSGAIKNLDVEFAIAARDIKVPEGSSLEAAAAKIGEQRAKELSEAAGEETAAAGKAENSFGVDPVAPSDLGETKEQREEEIKAQLNDDEEDEEGLC